MAAPCSDWRCGANDINGVRDMTARLALNVSRVAYPYRGKGMNVRSKTGGYALLGILSLAIIAIYVYPFLATTYTVRAMDVPPNFAPDLSLYLNLSNLRSTGGGEIIDPYYGLVTQPNPIGVVTFRLAFQLFGLLERFFGGDLWVTAMVWNIAIWTAICGAGIWLFEEVVPESASPIRVLGLSLLLLFPFGTLHNLLMGWAKLPSFTGFQGVGLPYIRTFFPQAAIVWLLLYLCLLIRVQHRPGWLPWAWMFVVQGLAFAMFPYTTALMAGTTLVAVLPFLSIRSRSAGTVLLFGLACGAGDLAYFLRNWNGESPHLLTSFFQFHPEIISRLAGGTTLLLIVLTLLTALLPAAGSREAKWTVFGLGLSNAVMLLGDILFSPALQITPHAVYFFDCTVAIEVTYLAAVFYLRFEQMLPGFRWAVAVVVVGLLVNGTVLAATTYRDFLPMNWEIANLAQVLRSVRPGVGDLVIVKARSVDDPCAWVPLLTRATVLFCRNSQVALTTEQRETIYRVRQAFYLYFTGQTSETIKEITVNQDATGSNFLTIFGQTREQEISSIQSELMPVLLRLEKEDSGLRSFFQSFKRILVIDSVERPIFRRERLAAYLSLGDESPLGGFAAYWSKPIQ
jgi:hypothetical protein